MGNGNLQIPKNCLKNRALQAFGQKGPRGNSTTRGRCAMVLSGQRSPLHLGGSTPLCSADRLRRQREATAVRTLAHYLVLEPTVTAQRIK